MGRHLDAAGNQLTKPKLKNSREVIGAASVNAGENRLLLDFTAGNIQWVELSANISAFTFTHDFAAGVWSGCRLYLKQDGTGTRLVSWPSSFKWPDGTAPTLSTAAGAIDVILIATMDGGTTYEAELVAAGLSGLAFA